MMRRLLSVAFVFVLIAAGYAGAADWPMWRYDAGHTGISPEKLPKQMRLQWVLELPPIEHAWPDEGRLEFDLAYEPIVAGGLVYIGSPQNDAVMAFDAETGVEVWRFHTGGPVRLAPAIAGGLLYAGSDDGFLYCLDAATGVVQWQFKAALSGRKVIGNTRMISVWPVRGAPVVENGVVYFAAGIWPFEGVSVYALDAKTGGVIWLNDNCDVPYMLQPHHSFAFSGLAPQGYLAVAGDKLLVPNGRAAAACLDRKTGKRLYFEMDPNNRFGDYRVSVKGDYFVNPGALYRIEDGQNLGSFPSSVIMTDETIAGIAGGSLRAIDVTSITVKISVDSKKRKAGKWEATELWSLELAATDMIGAGDRIYACKPGGICALDMPRGKGTPKIAWEIAVEGEPLRLAAANGRLYASTREGRIYCFAEKKQEVKTWPLAAARDLKKDAARVADAVIEATAVTEGYALGVGESAVEIAAALADKSKLRIVALDSETTARKTLDAAGLYGSRVAVLDNSARLNDLPAYFASVAVVTDTAPERAADREWVAALYERLRPYGGVACISGKPEALETLGKTIAAAALPGAEFEKKDGLLLLKRVGPLPDSADWTHQYADASNSVVSRDARVRAPLGLLWFGGSSNADILPRHGHGPSEQVIAGRLFIEGPDMIRALDVYTGRVLWQVSLPKIGQAYDNTSHQPGANALGSNYVSTEDGIYVAYGAKCLRLDPATGKLLSEFSLPTAEGAAEAPDFGHIAVWNDILVAGSGPLRYDEEIKGETWNAVASKRIVALNRHTGEALWSYTSDAAFRHNAIALGDNKVFCIDRATDELRDRLARRGITLPEQASLLALDIQTGKEIWRIDQDVFGTWLGYSQDHGILLQAGRGSRDSLKDEAKDRMTTHKAVDGSVVWDREVAYSAPCMLRGDTIIAQEKFFSLLTGESVMRQNPLTGAQLDMNWQRQYGCNSAVASLNLVTFRSAAAGFFDLAGDGGTGNLGGFKSGCTSNLLAANGVLNAPDYTRTCVCSYQNQTSLAFVYTPDVEMWTYNAFKAGPERVRRIGVNLGAPGDRRDGNGTLWLDYPSVGGQSPDIPVVTEPAEPDYYRYHSLRMSGDGLNWVAASGAQGLRRVRITVEEAASKPSLYTVKLHFAEPDTTAKGARQFDVALQGKSVLTDFDVVAEAGGPRRALVKEFAGIEVKDALEIILDPKGGAETLLCGVELLAQE